MLQENLPIGRLYKKTPLFAIKHGLRALHLVKKERQFLKRIIYNILVTF
jgi:hypothetical protein